MISSPEPLNPDHHLSGFESGEPDLDVWLQRRALANQVSGASRTFVIQDTGRVIGFYSLATAQVTHAVALGRFRRNMPDPIPVVVLARLAVDRAYQGQGLGRRLLRSALLRILAVAEQVGLRGVLVHAISEDAKRFYQSFGFSESPIEPMTLMATIQEIARALERQSNL